MFHAAVRIRLEFILTVLSLEKHLKKCLETSNKGSTKDMYARIISDELNGVFHVYCANCDEFLGFAVQKNNGASWRCIKCQQLNRIKILGKHEKTIWDWLNDPNNDSSPDS